MRYFSAAWIKSMDEALDANPDDYEKPEWSGPIKEYEARNREIEHLLPSELRRLNSWGSLHDGIVLALSLRGDDASIFVAVDRGYDELDRVVTEIVELRYIGVKSFVCRVAEGETDGTQPPPEERWPPRSTWLYDEVDLSDDGPGLFFHGVLVENVVRGLMEIEVVFKDFVMRSAPLLSLPWTGTAVWKSGDNVR